IHKADELEVAEEARIDRPPRQAEGLEVGPEEAAEAGAVGPHELAVDFLVVAQVDVELAEVAGLVAYLALLQNTDFHTKRAAAYAQIMRERVSHGGSHPVAAVAREADVAELRIEEIRLLLVANAPIDAVRHIGVREADVAGTQIKLPK
nr:hypothetical protein [Tanacetum cinerariifolium]